MGYHIEAYLKNGQAHLEVLDASSQSVRMAWHYRPSDDNDHNNHAEKSIQRLFRQLFLLSAARKLDS